MVGNDADVHGCAPSTGSDWSVLRETCIQVWNTGVMLMPLKSQGSATFSADVVFAHWYDHHRAEVFLREVKGSLVLEKAHGAWRGNGYTLTRHAGVYTLVDPKGEPIYAGPVKAAK